MGTDLFQFASAGSIVTGIDLSPSHLEIATKRFSLHNIPANLQLADAENLPFNDEAFDVVYTFGTIHHTPDTQKAIDEIYRVLKPDGYAIIGVYNKYSAFFLFSVLGPYIWKLIFLKETYRQALAKIEHRENSDACPLVKIYSRRMFKKMLQRFKEIRIECVHFGRTHFGLFNKFIPKWILVRFKNHLGWYLVAKCRK